MPPPMPPPADPGPGYGQQAGFAPPPYGQAAPSAQYGYAAGPVDRLGRPLADWWQRLVAIILDIIILAIPKSIVTAIAITSHGSRNTYYAADWRVSVIIVGIIFAAIDIAYFAILNGSEKGQTVGQMALGIAVRDEETGGAIGPQRAALRILVLDPGILLAWIPVVSFVAGVYTLVAGLSPLWDSRRQGFHDKVAHTDVIKVR
jgi:uncharacterized RDD family membrane protein YckC